MIVTALVPTYRRTADLARCLDALEAQRRAPDEVLVVARTADEETRAHLAARPPSRLPVRVVDVAVPGQVAALNAGLDAARGDVVAITDDDAAPHPDWIERIAAHYEADPRLGALGGKDRLFRGGALIEGAADVVGRITWWGMVYGNHHLGRGAAREVDNLKGANLTVRRSALEGVRFDARLRGEGAQYRNDMALCLAIRARGWRVVYDPAVLVDHFTGARFERDQRRGDDLTSVRTNAHNTLLTLLAHGPRGRALAFVAFSTLVGTRAHPGLAQALRLVLPEGTAAIRRLAASWAGLRDGLRTWRRAPA